MEFEMKPPKLIIPKGWEECPSGQGSKAYCYVMVARIGSSIPLDLLYPRRIKRKPSKRKGKSELDSNH